MSGLVIDACVAAKWLFAEEDTPLAEKIFDLGASLLAPEYVRTELANVAWKRFRRADLDRAGVTVFLADPQTLPLALTTDATLLRAALELAVQYDHPVYDCLYVALAERADAILVTTDRRLIAAFADMPVAPRLRHLRDHIEAA